MLSGYMLHSLYRPQAQLCNPCTQRKFFKRRHHAISAAIVLADALTLQDAAPHASQSYMLSIGRLGLWAE